jgi:RHS repeat-associated protein
MLKNAAPTTYLYDAANQLNRYQDSTGYTTNTFDGSGNLARTLNPSNQRTTNTWDGENRLTRVALPTGVPNTFAYNGDGLRVQKQDSTGTAKHVWDEQNIVLETDGSNIIQSVYSLEPVLFGNLVSQRRSGATSYYLFDALGSTRQLAGSAGSVTDTYLYDSWGNVLAAAGPTVNWMRYVGRLGYYLDTDLAAYYLRARFYDPVSGRFLSQDPLGIDESINLFIYVMDSPLGFFDPGGMVCAPDPCAKQEWSEERCRDQPPCPCKRTKTASEGFDRAQAAQDGWEKMGLAYKCRFHVLSTNCTAGPKISWTCIAGRGRKKDIYVCLSEDLDSCEARAAIKHELVHAFSYCKQGSLPTTRRDREVGERRAYTASCEMRARLECVKDDDKKAWIARCVEEGVKISLKEESDPENTCRKLIDRVFF